MCGIVPGVAKSDPMARSALVLTCEIRQQAASARRVLQARKLRTGLLAWDDAAETQASKSVLQVAGGGVGSRLLKMSVSSTVCVDVEGVRASRKLANDHIEGICEAILA